MQNLMILFILLSICILLILAVAVVLLLLSILRSMPKAEVYRDRNGKPAGNWKSLLHTLGIHKEDKPPENTMPDKSDDELSDEEYINKYPESVSGSI